MALKSTPAKRQLRRKPRQRRHLLRKPLRPKRLRPPESGSDVLTLKHLAAELSEAHEMPKKQAELVVSDFIDRIGGHLKKGKKLRISGLGILQVRKSPARKGRNPATGEEIKIKASKKVAFRPSKDLKERVL